MSDTITIMRFRLQDGKTTEDWMKVNEKVSEWVLRQPGFRFRSLSRTNEGEWIIMNYWTSMEDADAAEKCFRREMEGLVAPFIDMTHFDISRSHAMQMVRGDADRSNRRYRLARFAVPEGAREEFLGNAVRTRDFLRKLPGLLQDMALEQVAEDGVRSFVTLAEWESPFAFENAQAAVASMRLQANFDAQKMFERLGIEAELADYKPIGA